MTALRSIPVGGSTTLSMPPAPSGHRGDPRTPVVGGGALQLNRLRAKKYLNEQQPIVARENVYRASPVPVM